VRNDGAARKSKSAAKFYIMTAISEIQFQPLVWRLLTSGLNEKWWNILAPRRGNAIKLRKSLAT
jgi:hypothetical protein